MSNEQKPRDLKFDWKKLEKAIQEECVAWACWGKMDEEEQNETFAGYLLIGKLQYEQDKLAYDALKAEADKLAEALEDIQSTKKSGLLENPAYWGQMIVGRSSEALQAYRASFKIEESK